jgi:hypothetical protein
VLLSLAKATRNPSSAMLHHLRRCV